MSDEETGGSVRRGRVLCGPDAAGGLRERCSAASRDVATVTASAVAPSLSPNDTIKEFCTGCHNQYDLKGELDLENFDVAKAADHAATGEKMIRKLRAGLMPPKSEPQPDRDTRMALVTALETTLDEAAAKPNPGPPDVPAPQPRRVRRRGEEHLRHRRRRRGVSAVGHDQRELRQHRRRADALGDGDAGLHARGRVRQRARSSAIPSADASSTTYEVPRTQSQKDRVEGAPFGTRGGIVVTHNFLADGDYKFQLLLHGEPTGALFGRTIGTDSDGSRDRRRARGAHEGRSLDLGIRSRTA